MQQANIASLQDAALASSSNYRVRPTPIPRYLTYFDSNNRASSSRRTTD